MAEESRLLELASAIAEGSKVNWDAIEQASSDQQERSVVHELRVLADIADVANSAPSESPVMTESPSSERSKVWGHLRLIELVGVGSFGSVFRAWDDKLQLEVALKLMRSSDEAAAIGSPRPSKDLLKEPRMLARVRHHNVVRVFGADCHDGAVGLWMELVKGRTLLDIVKAHGPMSADEATLIGMHLCGALAAVHRAGLLHRDLKASNVMREDGGRVVLMDFGAGRPIPAAGEWVLDIVGSPAYLAPELFLGRKPSATSDIYSLGVLLYHLVTGQYPVEGSKASEVELAHQQQRAKPLRDARPDLPAGFVSVVERTLSPNPKLRYQTAGSLGAALAAATGVPYNEDSERPAPNGWPAWKWLTAAAVGILLVAALWFVRAVPSRNPSPSEASFPAIAQPSATPAAPQPGAYRVSAAFYAFRDGQDVELAAGSNVSPGDRLFLTLDVSQPVFTYVVNQDEKGESYLLFPLPGQELTNPVRTGVNRIPGSGNGDALYWQVTSAGGREHFYVFVTPERLTAFEQMLTALPHAEIGKPVLSAPLSKDAIGILRGVGGLVKADDAADPIRFRLLVQSRCELALRVRAACGRGRLRSTTL